MPVICVKLQNKHTDEEIFDDFLVQESEDCSIEAHEIVSEEYGDDWDLVEIVSSLPKKKDAEENKNVGDRP